MAVFTFRSGLRDEFNNVRPMVAPGLLTKLAGIEVEEFDTVTRPVSVEGDISGTAKLWCDVVDEKNAEVLGRYAGEHYAGKAAITGCAYGNGYVYYVGCDLDDEAMKALVHLISKRHGVETYDLPENVERI